MTRHLLSSALIAGFATGIFFAVLQYAFVEGDILLAERYESGELVHFAAEAPQGGHDHAHEEAGAAAAADPGAAQEAPPADVGPPPDHDHHAHGTGEAQSPVMRHGLTVLFAGLTYVSFALVLVAGYALAGVFGRKITLQTGLLWGLAGFLAVQMAPAMGLEPELPGTLAAALASRQAWWVMTALATAAGLGLIGYGRGPAWWLGGIALLALPHVIGAPDPGGFSGVAPPELAARFAAHSLGVGLLAWVFLGGLLAKLWNGGPGPVGV